MKICCYIAVSDYHLVLYRDLGLLQDSQYEGIAKELTTVRKMLASLRNAIERKTELKAKAAGKS